MSTPKHRVGVLLLNFGEPDEPTVDEVQPFLERIFLRNAGLEPDRAALERARELAAARAPELIREYHAIGGSPLKRQADQQAAALEAELAARNWDVRAYAAFQFSRPLIAERVAEARADGVHTLMGLPIYPLCGATTTVAALEEVSSSLGALAWTPERIDLSGWHHHPAYVGLRADHVRDYAAAHDLQLTDPDTLLHFSVHGTPLKYLGERNRYDRYVEEHCRDVARRLGVRRYGVGFQNHPNRPVAWTQPDNETRIREAPERRLVVVPIAFMHEQSETLSELDRDLRSYAESLGKEFHRVPVPHDSARFIRFLADLVADLVAGPATTTLTPCRCVARQGTWCTNGARELPPSRYASAAV